MIKTSLFIIAISIFLISCAQNDFEIKTKSVTQELSQVSELGAEAGNTPYNFAVLTTDGKTIVLGDFLRSKKPVIVYFFATWCPWCAKDFEALSKVYKDYEDKASIVAISLDLNEDLEIISKYKKKYPALEKAMFAPGQKEILVNYRVRKTTTKYAIGGDGKIMYAGLGAFNEEQWKALLDALVKSGEAKSAGNLPVTSEKASVIIK